MTKDVYGAPFVPVSNVPLMFDFKKFYFRVTPAEIIVKFKGLNPKIRIGAMG